MIGLRRFRRDRHGRYRLALSGPERTLLRSLPEQAKELVAESEPSAMRLFPPAYPTDAEAEADYRRAAGASLLDRHRRALDTVIATVDEGSVDEEQAHEWLDAIEVLRLVVGTQLDVTEELVELQADDPRAAHFAVYGYLSMLQDDIVTALSEDLPPQGTGAEPPEVDEAGLDAIGGLSPPDGLEGWLGP